MAFSKMLPVAWLEDAVSSRIARGFGEIGVAQNSVDYPHGIFGTISGTQEATRN
jgi:hypothetical protein